MRAALSAFFSVGVLPLALCACLIPYPVPPAVVAPYPDTGAGSAQPAYVPRPHPDAAAAPTQPVTAPSAYRHEITANIVDPCLRAILHRVLASDPMPVEVPEDTMLSIYKGSVEGRAAISEILSVWEPIVSGQDAATRAETYRAGAELCIETNGAASE